MAVITCKFCGKINRTGRKGQKYCSKKCGEKYRYRLNPQKYIDNATKYKQEHPEKVKNRNEYHKKYYQKNKEKLNKTMLKYYKNNSIKWNIRSSANTHKNEIIKQQNYVCNKCGKPTDKFILHVLDWDWKTDKFGKKRFNLNRDKVECLCKKCHPHKTKQDEN